MPATRVRRLSAPALTPPALTPPSALAPAPLPPAGALRLGLAFVLVLVLALCGCGGSSSAGSLAASTQSPFDGAAFPAGVRSPDFTLRDQLGRTVSLSRYRGREVVVLAFLSSRCRSCLLIAQQVRGALDELAERPTYGRGTAVAAMAVVFVSTDPHVDTPASVRRFLSETALSGRVLYLTGTEAQLRPVWRDYHIPPPSAGRAATEAAATVLLIGPSGEQRVGFGIEQITPEGLSHDIRVLRDGRAAPAG